MPAVLRLNAPAIAERFDQAGGYIGVDGGFAGFQAFVDRFNKGLGIPERLSALGVTDPDIPRLIKGALADPSCGGNPIELTAGNVEGLLAEVL